MYSRSTDSWRELASDNDMGYVSSIKSMCKNGHFAHWKVERMSNGEDEILSLDMKNEVYKKIMLPEDNNQYRYISKIFAKDEDLFWRFDSSPHDKVVHIYESRCEGRKLSWMYMRSVELPNSGIEIIPRWNISFFVIELARDALVYDYRTHNFICRLTKRSLIEYTGSFVSLEKRIEN